MTSTLVSSTSASAAALAAADGRAQRRGGRPVVSDDRGKRARASAALTVFELDVVRRAARVRGQRVSHFIRHAALEAAGAGGGRIPGHQIPPEWREVWTGLAPLAGNLNTIGRHLNTLALAGSLNSEAIAFDQLQALLQALVDQVSDLRRVLVPTK